MSRTVPVVRLLSLLAAFSAATAQPRAPDITATYARVDTIDLKIDLHLPPPARSDADRALSVLSPRPVVLWIHGGSWRGGDRGEECPAIPLLDSGYLVASIDYRFSQQALWPAQLHDAKAAVRWLRAHAADLRIDTARVAAWGTSAGGHLAAMLGVTSPADSLEGAAGAGGGASSGVRAVVDYFGASNFLEPVPRRWARGSSVGQLLGCAVPDCRERAWRASPVAYATPDDSPFFIVHGTEDGVVPFSQSVALDSALRAAGVPVEFVPLPGADHGGPAFTSPALLARVSAFLDGAFAYEPPRPAFPDGSRIRTIVVPDAPPP